MKVTEVHLTDNTQDFINAKDEAVERALEIIGLKAEGYAKLKRMV